ncbi:MAG: gamma-glutamylcyclotransferase [Nitriliruptoraceae bacterium]
MALVGGFDPRDYPGPRAAGPVLLHRGRTWPLGVDGTRRAPLRRQHAQRDRLDPRGRPPPFADEGPAPAPGEVAVLDAPEQVRFSVAYGANASPSRLVDKGLDVDGAVLLPARLAGFVPVFEARRTDYGAVPLTLVAAADAVIDTWLLGVPASATDRLDASEGRRPDGGAYRLGAVGEVAVAERFRLPRALAYRPGPTTRIQLDADGRPRTWPEVDQADAQRHLDAGGPSGTVADVDAVVTGDWPATPLDDLPLFVYGSLQPGQAGWPLIDGDVEVVGPARAAGQLYDSGHAWPAARLPAVEPGAAPPGVQGTVLTVRDPDAAPALLERIDAYEGAPELFTRSSVLVETAEGRRFALAYQWASTTPPGDLIDDGVWPGGD